MTRDPQFLPYLTSQWTTIDTKKVLVHWQHVCELCTITPSWYETAKTTSYTRYSYRDKGEGVMERAGGEAVWKMERGKMLTPRCVVVDFLVYSML